MKHWTLACLVSLILIACNRPSDGPTEAAPGSGDPAAAEADESGSGEPSEPEVDDGPEEGEPQQVAEPEELFAEPEVRALLASWLDAQNTGDFDQYSALYNERFFGVKRSGPRTVEYDRAGWLDDRGRMFEGLTVEANDIEITTSSRTAVIRFTQRWATARYEDVGPKQLVLAWTGDRLAIAREEMLSSTIVNDQRANATTQTVGARPVVSVADTPYLIIDHDVPETVVLTGRPRSEERGFAASHAVEMAGSGAEANRGNIFAAGATVRLFGESGQRCEATLGDRRVLARMEPHFGSLQAWDGEHGERASDATVASEVFGMGHHVLVAELAGAEGDCGEALWAEPAGRPGATAYERVTLSPEIDTVVRGEFRRSQTYRRLQEAFESDYGGTSPWPEYDGPGVSVQAFGTELAPRVIVVSALGGPGCGDFSGAMAAVFRVSGDGEELTVEEGPVMLEHSLDVASVLELSGATYLLTEHAFWQLGAEEVERWMNFEVPSFDCPC